MKVKVGNKYRRRSVSNPSVTSVVRHIIAIDGEYCFVKYWRSKKWNYEVKHYSFFDHHNNAIVTTENLGKSDKV